MTTETIHEVGKSITKSTCGADGKLSSLDWLINCPDCRKARAERPAVGIYWTRAS